MPATSQNPIARFFASLERSFPLVLLLVCLLAFGVLIPWLGFYWDDWPWIWFYHLKGLPGLLEIDRAFRPLSGVVMALGGLLAGESRTGWQLYTLGLHWAAALCLWWALKKTWPENPVPVAWVALLFLVYPGFSQQFVAVNASRHLASLALFFLSVGLAVQASRQAERKRALLFTGAALLLMLTSLLVSEYAYGLVLLFPLFLWLGAPREISHARRLRQSLRTGLPYLLLAGAVFAWRSLLSFSVNYSLSLLEEFSASPSQGALQLLERMGQAWQEVLLKGWAGLLPLFPVAPFGPRSWLVYAALVIFTGVGLAVYFRPFEDTSRQRWILEALLLGSAVLLVGGLPFWLTRLDVKISFPNDRLALPFILGASLILVALVSLLPWRSLRLILLASLVALGVGAQFRHAVYYREDWEQTVSLLDQLAWRLPQIPENTLLLTPGLPLRFSTDNSLTAALNWMYFPEPLGERLPLLVLDTSLRFNGDSTALQAETTYARQYGAYQFSGGLGRALVLLFQPPACLRVLDAEVDIHRPQLGSDTRRLLAAATPPTFGQTLSERPSFWPEAILGEPGLSGWCTAFNRADLARQQRDWQAIRVFSEQASAENETPNHAAERLPLIEGFAHLGQWERALALTRETLDINKVTEPMLCATWERIDQSTADLPGKPVAFDSAGIIDCP